jgi:hypothetical protein
VRKRNRDGVKTTGSLGLLVVFFKASEINRQVYQGLKKKKYNSVPPQSLITVVFFIEEWV